MDGKRIRAFYANATAWNFHGDAELHIVAERERKAAEFDAWLDRERATARREGQAEAFDEGWKARAERDPLVMNVRGHSAPPPPHGLNPYRQEADQ